MMMVNGDSNRNIGYRPDWTNGNKMLHIKFKNNILYMKQFDFRFHFIFDAR